MGFFADRVQGLSPHDSFQPLIVWPGRRLYCKPGRLSSWNTHLMCPRPLLNSWALETPFAIRSIGAPVAGAKPIRGFFSILRLRHRRPARLDEDGARAPRISDPHPWWPHVRNRHRPSKYNGPGFHNTIGVHHGHPSDPYLRTEDARIPPPRFPPCSQKGSSDLPSERQHESPSSRRGTPVSPTSTRSGTW